MQWLLLCGLASALWFGVSVCHACEAVLHGRGGVGRGIGLDAARGAPRRPRDRGGAGRPPIAPPAPFWPLAVCAIGRTGAIAAPTTCAERSRPSGRLFPAGLGSLAFVTSCCCIVGLRPSVAVCRRSSSVRAVVPWPSEACGHRKGRCLRGGQVALGRRPGWRPIASLFAGALPVVGPRRRSAGIRPTLRCVPTGSQPARHMTRRAGDSSPSGGTAERAPGGPSSTPRAPGVPPELD